MVKLIVLATLLLFSAHSWAIEKVPASLIYSVDVPGAGALTACMNRIWIYSKIKKSLYVISPDDGRIVGILAINKVPSGGFEGVSALTCYKEKIVASVVFKKLKHSYVLATLELDTSANLQWVKTLKTPTAELVTDIQCNEKICVSIAGGQVFSSTDLSRWKKIEVPLTLKIQHTGIDTSTNPFDDWQEKLIIADGRISRLALLPNTELLLLDPFRTSVIKVTKQKTTRWGHWGVWEGRFMTPKALAVDPPSTVYVADPSLKAIFAYDINGDYRGVLTTKDKLLDVQYPFYLLYFSGKLFVSDLMGGKLLALEVSGTRAAGKIEESHVARTNLFHREEVLKDRLKNRCLLCHDGTITDETGKYLPGLVHHPIGIEAKEKTDLPLAEGKIVTCATCHDPHHGAGKKAFSTHPPFLLKDSGQLCLSCHKEKQDMTQNHNNKKSNGCLDCHAAHEGIGKNLKAEPPQLCLQCHGQQKIQHRSIEALLATNKAKNVHFSGQGEISCTTCHAPHHALVAQSLVKAPQQVMPFCASCHGEKTEKVFQNFHSLMKKRRAK